MSHGARKAPKGFMEEKNEKQPKGLAASLSKTEQITSNGKGILV